MKTTITTIQAIAAIVVIVWAGIIIYRKFGPDRIGQKPLAILAEESVTNCCQKNICGYQRIVGLDWDFKDYSAPASWKCDATVEYINSRGGWARTNYLLRFAYENNATERSVTAYEDYLEIIRRDEAAKEKDRLYKKWERTSHIEDLNRWSSFDSSKYKSGTYYSNIDLEFKERLAEAQAPLKIYESPQLDPSVFAEANQIADNARKAALEKQKSDQAQRTLEYHKKLAAEGDSNGLFRMGERYLKGDGVETNLLQAKIYLNRAANAGNAEAAALLEKIAAK